jgi:murein DD-endopeptidase MepM/ murein hydrolase activator NlpD
MNRRLLSHASLLGVIVLGLAFTRLPWQRFVSYPQGLAAYFISATQVVAAPGASVDTHAAHLASLASLPKLESSTLIRLTEPHTDKTNSIRPSVISYTIVTGDTPSTIASRFGLKPETLLWGNPLLSENAEALRVGTVINILPTDGVLHYTVEGDTLERLQLLYGVPVEDIVAYPGNEFPEEPPYPLTPGQKVIVPGGRKPVVWQEPGPPLVAGRGRKSPGYFSGPLVKTGTGYFIWPVPPDVITQYYWAGHPAIDIDTYANQPVLAADSGTVIFSGWDTTGYGNLIIIDHGNDLWTYYAHNNQNLVSVGQGVDQGQTIALSGSTGNSTGDHLDFRIRYQAAAFLDPIQFLP